MVTEGESCWPVFDQKGLAGFLTVLGIDLSNPKAKGVQSAITGLPPDSRRPGRVRQGATRRAIPDEHSRLGLRSSTPPSGDGAFVIRRQLKEEKPVSLTVGHELFGAPELAEGQPLSAHEARKFLFRTVAPAIIQPQEAEMLIDYTIDQSVLLREMTLVPMDTNELEVSGSSRSRAGSSGSQICNSGCSESVSISNTNKCLKTTSLDVKFFLCDDDIQDGLTGAQIEQQLIRMTGDQLNNELELFGIMGNTNGSYFATAAPPSPAVVNDAVMQVAR